MSSSGMGRDVHSSISSDDLGIARLPSSNERMVSERLSWRVKRPNYVTFRLKDPQGT